MKAFPAAPQSIEYRRDIDGLRAVAVLAVVIFHLFPQSLPGGFAGVDVFFVVSGYLISGIILHDLRNNAFSFRHFYSRRVRRIFPALTLVLAVSFALGWSLLLPDEFQRLSEQTLAGAGFVSNFLLSHQAGYFDAARNTKPLLHLWSLGIEEQFYIFWPITLAGLWKVLLRWPSKLLPAIVLIAAVSFALNIRGIHADPVRTFYLPVTRMWELLAGAALVRVQGICDPVWSHAASNVLGAAGGILLALSLGLLSEDKAFPGWWALWPVMGTVLIVMAGSESWLNRRLLSSRPAVLIGLISYPLYLWHWPLLVYVSLVMQSDYLLSPVRLAIVRCVTVAVAFLLAWVTWRFMETPIRFSSRIAAPAKVSLLAGALAIIGLLAARGLHHLTPRLGTPLAIDFLKAHDDARFLPINYRDHDFSIFEISAARSHATLFAGDSHMEHFLPRIDALLKAVPGRASAVFASHDGCLPLPRLNNPGAGYECPAFYEYWTAQAQPKRIDTVVISAFWETYTIGDFHSGKNPQMNLTVDGRIATDSDFEQAWKGLEETLRAFVQSGKRVVIFASTPSSPTFDPRVPFRRLHGIDPSRLRPLSRAEFEAYMRPVDSHLEKLARNSGVELLRPLDYMCDHDECPATDSAGSPLYRDNNHLRASKAARIATFVDDMIRP